MSIKHERTTKPGYVPGDLSKDIDFEAEAGQRQSRRQVRAERRHGLREAAVAGAILVSALVVWAGAEGIIGGDSPDTLPDKTEHVSPNPGPVIEIPNLPNIDHTPN